MRTLDDVTDAGLESLLCLTDLGLEKCRLLANAIKENMAGVLEAACHSDGFTIADYDMRRAALGLEVASSAFPIYHAVGQSFGKPDGSFILTPEKLKTERQRQRDWKHPTGKK